MRTIAAIQEQLLTTPDTGLNAEGRARSKQLFGANRLTPIPKEPLWKKFLEKFDEPIIKILLAAALLSMVVELFQGSGPHVQKGAIVGVIGVALVGAYVFRRKEWVPSIL